MGWPWVCGYRLFPPRLVRNSLIICQYPGHPATWLVGCIAFAPVLVGFYIYLERVLPAGY